MEVWALMVPKDSHCLQASLSHPRFQGRRGTSAALGLQGRVRQVTLLPV